MANAGVGVITRNKYELTPEIVDDLKQKLVDNHFEPKIYKFDNDGDVVVFRPLMFFDYQAIQAYVKTNGENISQDDIDRKICEQGIVWPAEMISPVFWEVQRAGLQSNLSKQILARSGFIVSEIDQSGYMSVEPLFVASNGPKPDEKTVAELRGKFNWSLNLVFCEGEYFVVRPISRAEWRALTSTESADLDLLISERVTVWCKEYPNPTDFSSRAAGIARTIAEISMGLSGFNNRSTISEL